MIIVSMIFISNLQLLVNAAYCSAAMLIIQSLTRTIVSLPIQILTDFIVRDKR